MNTSRHIGSQLLLCCHSFTLRAPKSLEVGQGQKTVKGLFKLNRGRKKTLREKEAVSTPLENRLAAIQMVTTTRLILQTIKSLAIGEQPSSDADGDDHETHFVED
ncbi:hypothetical protein Taro_036303 [Colocasia esculenta]|uniref:Uncharacterized protein n=1 Tax=Colocasia esculenta TaxID=4460 RepID=A0A843W181_COLES|nr:hypothetical protein [Colocasia esculenta]